MSTWGGYREGSGRPAEFNDRKGKVVYFEKTEIDELNRIVQLVNDSDGSIASASAHIRLITLAWIEEKRKEYGEARTIV